MSRTSAICLLCALTVLSGPAVAQLGPDLLRRSQTEDGLLILEGVTVIDGSGSAPLRDHSLMLEGGRIARLAPAGSFEPPTGATILYLEGHTVIPGLVGMHDHTHMPGITFMGATAPRLWLAGGVTTVQTAGSAEPEQEAALARAIAAGDVPGPTIFPTAPYITGPGGNAPMPKPPTEAAARAFVQEWSGRGASWFKLYRHVEPHIARAVIDEAHRQGRKVTGHLCSLSFSEAASMGIDSVEHGLISAADFTAGRAPGECTSNADALAALDPNGQAAAALIAQLVEEEVTITSTLAIIESHFPHRPQADARSLDVMSPEWRRRYDERQARLADSVSTTRYTPALLSSFMTFERRFAEAGGRLVMGPDFGRHVFPGFGNQRGFELLVEAGFSVPEAVKIATANGADALEIGDRTGRIAPDYEADLVVLRGDLFRNPAAIRNVEYVFSDGRAYDPQALIGEVTGRVGLE